MPRVLLTFLREEWKNPSLSRYAPLILPDFCRPLAPYPSRTAP
jgi:hypothetical protein